MHGHFILWNKLATLKPQKIDQLGKALSYKNKSQLKKQNKNEAIHSA